MQGLEELNSPAMLETDALGCLALQGPEQLGRVLEAGGQHDEEGRGDGGGKRGRSLL
jgi:hypothetical protein